MTIAYPSCSSLTVLFLALAAAACSSSSKKNDSTVLDASNEAQGGYPSLTTSSTLLDFPLLCPGQASAPKTVQIMNDGDSAVPVNVKVTGSNAADFTATATGCDLIAPGASCTVAVVFTPTTTFLEMAFLEVTTPAFDGLKFTISLQASNPGGPAPFTLSPSSSDLGSVAVGTTGPAVTITLLNNSVPGPTGCSGESSNGPYTVTLSSAEFVITDDTCSKRFLSYEGTCTISVAFRPTLGGATGAYLFVGLPSYKRTVALIGTGISIIDAGSLEPMDSGLGQDDAGNVVIDGR